MAARTSTRPVPAARAAGHRRRRTDIPNPAALLPEQPDGLGVLVKFFRALADPTRLRLLEFLLGGEHSVTECVELVGLAQGRVSSHLACLADCGFVAVRREGRYGYYRVVDPRVAELVLLTRSLAADNAAALAACVRIPDDASASGRLAR